MSALDQPSVAVIVPAHRRSEAFTRCLAALDALDPTPDELVVVVDGGDEDIAREVAAAGHRAILQHPQSGPAVARNSGAARVESDVLLFLDSDVAAEPDVVGRVRELFAEEPGVAAVIGSYTDDPPAYNLASLYTNLRHHYVHQRAREEGSTFWGACGAIRRDVFERLGGFDEDYVAPSIEDIELGYRLKAAGERIRVVKDLNVRHLKRWEAGSLLKTDVVFRALPWSALILRTRRLENDLNVSLAERAKSVLTLGSVLALVAALVWPPAAAIAVAALAVVLTVDAPFIRFLFRRGGARLALWGAGWHLGYHLYTILAFAATALRHLTFGAQPVQTPWPGSPRRWANDAPAPALVSAAAGVAGPVPREDLEDAVFERVVVEQRVAHASPTVALDRLLKQSRRVRWWVPIALLWLAGAAMLPVHRDTVGVDGLAYVRIAQYWADWDLDRALNAYWGPLYSWLLAPLLAVGIEPLLATKVLQLAVGAGVLVAVRRLCIRCWVRTATADGMTLVAVPLVLHLAVTEVYADLLFSFLLLLFVADVLPPAGARTGRHAPRAGLWGGLAFLAKPYALPVVVVSAVAVNVVAGWRARREEGAGVFGAHMGRAGFIVLAALVVGAPWALAISVHHGEPTVSRSWTYNAAVVAPGSTGQPMESGLVEPPYADALFAWEDPSTMTVTSRGWSDPGEASDRVVENLTGNVSGALDLVSGRYVVVPVFGTVGAAVLVWRRRTTAASQRSAWPAVILTVGVYLAGYLVTVVEQHYLWFVVLALFPLAAVAIDLPILRPSMWPEDPAYPGWRLLGFLLLAVAVAGEAAASLPRERSSSRLGSEAQTLRIQQPDAADALDGVRVASSGSWRGSSILCFHLGCTYLGVADGERTTFDEAARTADLYLDWGDDRVDAAGSGAFDPEPVAVLDGVRVLRPAR